MGRVKKIGIIVLAAVLVSVVTMAVYAAYNPVGVIRIWGAFSLAKKIEMIPDSVNIDLGVIKDNMGTRSFDNIAKLVVRNTSKIIAKVGATQTVTATVAPTGDNASGEALHLIMHGEITLDSGSKKYVIQMPCLYSIGDCIRILVLIPGYDAPMNIDPGEYSVSFKISWTAQGSGNVNININVQIVEAY